MREDYEWLAEDLEDALTAKPIEDDETDFIDETPVEDILKNLLNRSGLPPTFSFYHLTLHFFFGTFW